LLRSKRTWNTGEGRRVELLTADDPKVKTAAQDVA
jgi:hypothetical protein